MIVELRIAVEADEELLTKLRVLMDPPAKVQVQLGVRAEDQVQGVFRGAQQVLGAGLRG